MIHAAYCVLFILDCLLYSVYWLLMNLDLNLDLNINLNV